MRRQDEATEQEFPGRRPLQHWFEQICFSPPTSSGCPAASYTPLREYEQRIQPSHPVLVLILSAEAPVFRRKFPTLLPKLLPIFCSTAQEVIPHPTNINDHLMSVVRVVEPWDPWPALDVSSWEDQGSRPFCLAVLFVPSPSLFLTPTFLLQSPTQGIVGC